MDFKLLGGLELGVQAEIDVPSAPKQRQVLAMLVVNANRVTYVDSLIYELWGSLPPCSVQTTVQTYVYQLRRHFAAVDTDLPYAPIVTRPQGYMLQVSEDRIDCKQFESLIAQARHCLEEYPEHAALVLERAMRLWRGPMLADVSYGEILAGHVARMEELHMCAIELAMDAGLRIGRHRELVAELKSFVRQHPFNEALHAQLIRALALSGRRQEALTAFHEVRSLLQTELGIDPSPCLTEALYLVLSGGEVRERCA